MEDVNLVAILGVIGVFFLPFIMIIFIVWFRSKDRRRRYELQAELYAKAIEKGQAMPTDLFVETKKGQGDLLEKPKKKRNPLNTGIICIAVGIGIFLLIWLSQNPFFSIQVTNEGSVTRNIIPFGNPFRQAIAVGIIPFLIGAAYVVIHFIEKKKDADEKTQ